VGSGRILARAIGGRLEHLALLARWYYSSWSDGEWIGFHGLDQVPYRKLVRAISRLRQKAAEVRCGRSGRQQYGGPWKRCNVRWLRDFPNDLALRRRLNAPPSGGHSGHK
jgi:hypothetical protein